MYLSPGTLPVHTGLAIPPLSGTNVPNTVHELMGYLCRCSAEVFVITSGAVKEPCRLPQLKRSAPRKRSRYHSISDVHWHKKLRLTGK